MVKRVSLESFLRSRGFAVALAVTCTSLFSVGPIYFYPHLRIGPPQPIPFSHRLHVGVKEIDCHFCHYSVERSP